MIGNSIQHLPGSKLERLLDKTANLRTKVRRRANPVNRNLRRDLFQNRIGRSKQGHIVGRLHSAIRLIDHLPRIKAAFIFFRHGPDKLFPDSQVFGHLVLHPLSMSLAIFKPRLAHGYSRKAEINHAKEFEPGFAVALEHFRKYPWLCIKRFRKHKSQHQRILAPSIRPQPVDPCTAHLGELSGPVGVDVPLPGCLTQHDPVMLGLPPDFNRQGTAIERRQIGKGIASYKNFFGRSHGGLRTFPSHDNTIKPLIFRNGDLGGESSIAGLFPAHFAGAQGFYPGKNIFKKPCPCAWFRILLREQQPGFDRLARSPGEDKFFGGRDIVPGYPGNQTQAIDKNIRAISETIAAVLDKDVGNPAIRRHAEMGGEALPGRADREHLILKLAIVLSDPDDELPLRRSPRQQRKGKNAVSGCGQDGHRVKPRAGCKSETCEPLARIARDEFRIQLHGRPVGQDKNLPASEATFKPGCGSSQKVFPILRPNFFGFHLNQLFLDFDAGHLY